MKFRLQLNVLHDSWHEIPSRLHFSSHEVLKVNEETKAEKLGETEFADRKLDFWSSGEVCYRNGMTDT